MVRGRGKGAPFRSAQSSAAKTSTSAACRIAWSMVSPRRETTRRSKSRHPCG
jgi:hypothetical protein